MIDYSTRVNFLPCLHRHVVRVKTGGIHHRNGQTWDNTRERLLCLDCDEYVSDEQVLSGWHGVAYSQSNDGDQ